MASGIYKIENLVNGKCYIGSAVYLDKRIPAHKSNLKYNKHHNKHLQNAYNKYGKDNFAFSVIESVENKEDLVEREQFYIDSYDFDVLYNTRTIAESNLGLVWSEESRQKLSKSKKGSKHSEESKRKISEAHSGYKGYWFGKFGEEHTRFGCKASEETLLKLSLSHMGQKCSEETREKIRKSSTGRVHSEESKEKMSECQIGEKNSMYGVTGASHHNSKMIEFNGKSLNISGWAKELGVTNSTIARRLKSLPPSQALTMEKNPGHTEETKAKMSKAKTKYITFQGNTKSAKEWAEGLGIDVSSLFWRLKNWPLDKALTTSNLRAGVNI